MSAALEHAQWTELLGVSNYDHIVGSGIVVVILIAVSLRIKKHCSNNNALIPSENLTLQTSLNFSHWISCSIYLRIYLVARTRQESFFHYWVVLFFLYFFQTF